MAGIDKVSTFTIAVKDQEEALRWYTEKLGFNKRADFSGSGMRWLTIAPSKQVEVEFVLASWFPDFVGRNAPCVLETEDCRDTVRMLKERGVRIQQEPTERPYGMEAVFEDLYGNAYALLERERT